MRQTKTKLAVLDTPGFGQVLFDALHTYIGDARGEEVNMQYIAEMADAIIYSLRRQYLAELPAKQPAVKNRDLEDLIDEINSHPDYKKQKKSYELDKQEINPIDFLLKLEEDGADRKRR
jgi:hypothetical protein